MSNPITKNIKCLIECGWEREQAVNLVAELYSEGAERMSTRENLVKAVNDRWVAYVAARGAYDAAAWFDYKDVADNAYNLELHARDSWNNAKDSLESYDKERNT